MNSQTLQFELYENMRFFKVIFEAVSPQRNLLKDVILDGFHLDVVDLQRTHPLLYGAIKNNMQLHSEVYWKAADKQTTDVPDSAKEKILKKALLAICFLLFSLFSFSQKNEVVFSAHAEYSFHYTKPGFGFDAGYHFGHHYAGADSHLYFSRQRNIPVEVDLHYGYNIGSLQPFVTAGFYTCGGEAVHNKEGVSGIAFGAGMSYTFQRLPLRLTTGITGNNIYSSLAIVARL